MYLSSLQSFSNFIFSRTYHQFLRRVCASASIVYRELTSIPASHYDRKFYCLQSSPFASWRSNILYDLAMDCFCSIWIGPFRRRVYAVTENKLRCNSLLFTTSSCDQRRKFCSFFASTENFKDGGASCVVTAVRVFMGLGMVHMESSIYSGPKHRVWDV